MFKLNPALKSFWRTRKPYKGLKGGRFSSKTQDAAGMSIFLARNYTLKFMCVRQFQNRIDNSVYTVLKDKIHAAGWENEFSILKSSIIHNETGSEFIFYGINRNLTEIKGTEGVDICWIEEAEGLTKAQWDIIDPTIRKYNSEVWLLWNPRLQTDFIESQLPELLGDDYIVQHINYQDNPFLSDTARTKAERLKRVDYKSYEHIYLGIPLSDDDKAVIKLSWIEAAVDAHKKLDIDLSGRVTVGYDVADSGDDANAIAQFNGSVCVRVEEWQAPEDELVQSALKAWGFVGDGRLIYDSIGVGAHTGSTLNSNGIKGSHYKFNAGGGVVNPDVEYSDSIKNKEKFENLKAQACQELADRFRDTYNAVVKGEDIPIDRLISIDSSIDNIEKLKRELSTPHKRISKRGLDMVETKDELKKRDIPSPNLADAFVMGASPHLAIIEKPKPKIMSAW